MNDLMFFIKSFESPISFFDINHYVSFNTQLLNQSSASHKPSHIRPYNQSNVFNHFYYLSSSGDLQPSTALANQLPGQLVSTQIRTTRPNCFKFIIALIMTSTNIVWIDEWLFFTLYLLDHKACIAGAESTEIPDTNMMSGA